VEQCRYALCVNNCREPAYSLEEERCYKTRTDRVEEGGSNAANRKSVLEFRRWHQIVSEHMGGRVHHGDSNGPDDGAMPMAAGTLQYAVLTLPGYGRYSGP